eukprot:gene9312-14435_t
MGNPDAQALNQELRSASYLGGVEPSAKDREALQKLVGGDMRVLQWAGRMASYYPAERRAMCSGAAAPAAAGGKAEAKKGDDKKAKPAKPAKQEPAPKPAAKMVHPKVKCSRDIGGAEGSTQGIPLDQLTSRPIEWPVQKVRQTFIDFFVTKKNLPFVASSPSVPTDDPTLLFTNAGMNQFKGVFLGTEKPNSDLMKIKGAVNSQKCIRAGGKHNDLDDVGKDTYHHTFFEMLGNWSFGDYFKKEAIAWSWELLTEVYKLPKDRLYATYFEGNKELNLPPDLEAKKLWGQFLPESRILPGDMKDNFWEMGEVGPCGPCSELHYDRVGGRDAAYLVNNDDPLVIEIWNLVFMTHTRTPKGVSELPAKHVDTGMGLERIASILQDVFSNYNTDGWFKIFAAIKEVTGYPHDYHSDACPEDAVVAYRVVADHIRTITISLTDGGIPDNNGRGYVLRRIIRRAVRFGKEFLGAPLGFFSKVIPAVVAELGPFFKELQDKATIDRVTAIVYDEETAFDKTWTNGVKHFKEALKKCRDAKTNVVAGADAFILHDRYGFPIDLTIIMAEKEKCKEPFVDMKEFERIMTEAQDSSRHSMKLKQFLGTNEIDHLQKSKIPATNDDSKYIWKQRDAKIVAIVDKPNEALVQELGVLAVKKDPKAKKSDDPAAEHMGVILDETNFYYESGGQIYDTGLIKAKDGSFTVKVTKVLSMGGYVCHIGKVESGVVKAGAAVTLDVDYSRRIAVGANHTVTHQLNHSLREVLELGKNSHLEVNQKGSAVEELSMRFDFSWNEKVPTEDIAQAEKVLNATINEGRKVYSKVVPLDQASQIQGIRKMFGEKYPDPVRVVSIGKDVDELLADPANPDWKKYSVEFCGGTHLESLSDIQVATIVGEEALMKGIRRMTVLTRGPAKEALAAMEKLSKEHEEIFKKPHDAASIDDKIKSLSVHSKKIGDHTLPIVAKATIQKEIEAEIKVLYSEKKALVAKVKADALEFGTKIGEEAKASGNAAVVKAVNQWGADREALNEVCTGISKAYPEALLFITACDVAKGKGLAMTAVPKGSPKSAVDWLKAACGKGGGNAEKAQSGFTAGDEGKVIEAAAKWI